MHVRRARAPGSADLALRARGMHDSLRVARLIHDQCASTFEPRRAEQACIVGVTKQHGLARIQTGGYLIDVIIERDKPNMLRFKKAHHAPAGRP